MAVRSRQSFAVLAVAAALCVPVAGAQAGAHTLANVYEAYSYHGVIVPHVTVQSGYCTSSSKVTLRLDAWRCVAGTTILDPCFSSEFADNVVCPMPWNDTGTEINLTKPLPTPTNHASPSLRLAPWAIEITAGAACVLTSGAAPSVHGKRLNYVCSAKLGLWGYPDRKTQPWTIVSAAPTAKTLSHHSAILHAWM